MTRTNDSCIYDIRAQVKRIEGWSLTRKHSLEPQDLVFFILISRAFFPRALSHNTPRDGWAEGACSALGFLVFYCMCVE